MYLIQKNFADIYETSFTNVISIIIIMCTNAEWSRNVCCRKVQNQFDCSASLVLARGRRPGKVSEVEEILPFSKSHKGFSCIIFVGACRRIASSDGGSTGARIKGGKAEGRRKTTQIVAEQKNGTAPAWSAEGKTRATSFIDWNRWKTRREIDHRQPFESSRTTHHAGPLRNSSSERTDRGKRE